MCGNCKDECAHPEKRPKDGKCGEELQKECHGKAADDCCCAKQGK